MSAPADAFEAGLRVAQALESRGVSYALGGALALGHHAIPRATNDVDVNVFVAPDGLATVFAALGSLGIAVDEGLARRQAEAEGMFEVWLPPFRVDVFTPSIDFCWEAERTRVRARAEGQDLWFLSAEALAVFKLLFFRRKDLADLERLIAVKGRDLDAGLVRRRMTEMMGEGDERVRAWDELVAQHLPG